MINNENSILKIDDLITLNIESIAHGGHFVARHKGQVIFVRHAITDEIAIVKITSISNKLAFGDAIEIIKPSKDRITPLCKYSLVGNCGGCDFQHISIIAQRKLKKFVIQDQFKRIAKIDINTEIININPTSGLNWRTRFDFAISENKKIGLYSYKSNKVIEINECLIAVDAINKSDIFKLSWEGKERVRVSASSTNEVNINRLGKNISGPIQLSENIKGNSYKISPGSFWQSHKNAPDILIKKVLEFAKIKFGDCVCDLYGGIGLFTSPILKLIRNSGKVHLIENDRNCINDAREIFKENKNVIIHNGKVEQKIGKIKNIDIVILDPPRNGAGKQVINQIINKKPRSIIYVSCDPASLARDTKILINNSYKLENLIGIDLFPMTHHIECIASYIKEEKKQKYY